MHLHLKKKKPKTPVLSQVIGETFLSSNFLILLRDDWSFVWKQCPQPVRDSQPGLERCFCTTLHSTLVLQEFITWDAVVVEQQGAASSLVGWGPASPSGHQQLCMKAAPPCWGVICILDHLFTESKALITVWLKLFVESIILGIGGEFRYCTDATEECGKCRQSA